MEHVLIWEPKPLPKIEFRLYYDDKGKVVCYTCEKLEGNYIVIDAETYAIGRPDVRVIDGKISTVAPSAIVTKLIADANDGIECAYEDMSIVVDTSYTGKKQKWKLDIHEL
jgi:hypothetical protein